MCSNTLGILLYRKCGIHLVSSKDVNLKFPARPDTHPPAPPRSKFLLPRPGLPIDPSVPAGNHVVPLDV